MYSKLHQLYNCFVVLSLDTKCWGEGREKGMFDPVVNHKNLITPVKEKDSDNVVHALRTVARGVA